MMAVPLVISALLAALSVGHDQNYQTIYNDFFSNCSSIDEIIQLITGNFSNECTRMPSINADGQPGTKSHLYLQSGTSLEELERQGAPNVVCATIEIAYFVGHRIYTATITLKDPITAVLKTVTQRRLQFQPLIYNRNHTMSILAGTCSTSYGGGEIRAIAITNDNAYGGVLCSVLPEGLEENYAVVATSAKNPCNATLAGYENMVDQVAGQVISYNKYPQNFCP